MAEIHRIEAENSPGFKHLVNKAVEIFKSNKIAAMPSDTIYGILGRCETEVIERIHSVKKRDQSKPFLFLAGKDYPLEKLVSPDSLAICQKAFDDGLWPGRNTLLFHKKPNLEYPKGEKIAIRIPSRNDNPFLFEVLQALGEPLLAPSLNYHGERPLEKLEDITVFFGKLVDLIFYDESFIPKGASSIIDATTVPYRKIR